MSREDKPPYIVEAAKPESGRAATLIYLHGYSDDAEGLPLGLAQQFQMYNRAEYLRWVLPNQLRDLVMPRFSNFTLRLAANQRKPSNTLRREMTVEPKVLDCLRNHTRLTRSISELLQAPNPNSTEWGTIR